MRLKNTIFLLCFATLSSAQVNTCQHSKGSSLPPGLYYNSENLRSDTINILKYTINLEIGNSFTKLISGNTAVKFVPKLNNTPFLRLDLLKLTIDSIKENNTTLSYAYNDTIIKVNFALPKNISDTSTISVYYKGQPQGDATGWGGFYFDNSGGNQYAYNLGVGFGAKPHNYGRVWFPCFDNFVERSQYEFNITSDTLRRAYCNGQLISDNVTGLKRTRKWVLNEEIPTYLASVALAKYTQVNWTVNTLTGIKQIILAGAAADTSAMKNGFVNLKACINGFENYYGSYKWNRFGYCLVPFNSGAMEHATNIAYPRAAVGIGYEAELMAHELSHHWWGDLITCETAEDMWINEGLATYSQYMFTEWKYGKKNYTVGIKANHENLLHFLHKKEGGFRAISGIPHNLTYGDHVYKKGADVAHTLRGYLGDSAFFAAIKYTMNQNQYKSVNSIQLRDLLQTGSGKNLVDFFNNWVLAGGWPHFAIDSVKYLSVGTNSVNAIVSLKQKLYGAATLYSNVPIELSFFKADWSRITRTVLMSGSSATFTVNIPFNAVYCALNYDSKISDATSFENLTLKNTGTHFYNYGKTIVYVKNKGSDSSLVRIVHNYVTPDPFKNNPQNHILSDQHYWNVEGILSLGFHAKIKFYYDGTKYSSGTYTYLDTLLTRVNGDSVRIFYRPSAKEDWVLVKNCIRNNGTKVGFIELDTMKLGQYTFANSTDTATINFLKENKVQVAVVKLYPNPAKNNFKVEFEKLPGNSCVVIVSDIQGKEISSRRVNERINYIDVSGLAKGAYIVQVEDEGRSVYTHKIILE